MKKLSLFLLGCFATTFMSFAQDITPEMFVLTKNTGANMTVGINSPDFDQFAVLSNGIWLTGIAVATILTITRKTKAPTRSLFVRYETRTQTLKIQGTKSKLKISKQVFEEH